MVKLPTLVKNSLGKERQHNMTGYISKVKAAKDKLGYDPFDQINDPGVPCEQQRVLSPEEKAFDDRLRAFRLARSDKNINSRKRND